MDANGRVVDPSWRNDGLAYVGEIIDTEAEARRMVNDGYFELAVDQIAPAELVPELERLAEIA